MTREKVHVGSAMQEVRGLDTIILTHIAHFKFVLISKPLIALHKRIRIRIAVILAQSEGSEPRVSKK